MNSINSQSKEQEMYNFKPCKNSSFECKSSGPIYQAQEQQQLYPCNKEQLAQDAIANLQDISVQHDNSEINLKNLNYNLQQMQKNSQFTEDPNFTIQQQKNISRKTFQSHLPQTITSRPSSQQKYYKHSPIIQQNKVHSNQAIDLQQNMSIFLRELREIETSPFNELDDDNNYFSKQAISNNLDINTVNINQMNKNNNGSKAYSIVKKKFSNNNPLPQLQQQQTQCFSPKFNTLESNQPTSFQQYHQQAQGISNKTLLQLNTRSPIPVTDQTSRTMNKSLFETCTTQQNCPQKLFNKTLKFRPMLHIENSRVKAKQQKGQQTDEELSLLLFCKIKQFNKTQKPDQLTNQPNLKKYPYYMAQQSQIYIDDIVDFPTGGNNNNTIANNITNYTTRPANKSIRSKSSLVLLPQQQHQSQQQQQQNNTYQPQLPITTQQNHSPSPLKSTIKKKKFNFINNYLKCNYGNQQQGNNNNQGIFQFAQQQPIYQQIQQTPNIKIDQLVGLISIKGVHQSNSTKNQTLKSEEKENQLNDDLQSQVNLQHNLQQQTLPSYSTLPHNKPSPNQIIQHIADNNSFGHPNKACIKIRKINEISHLQAYLAKKSKIKI